MLAGLQHLPQGPEFFVWNFQETQWSVKSAELLIGPDEHVAQDSSRRKGILSKPLRICFRIKKIKIKKTIKLCECNVWCELMMIP